MFLKCKHSSIFSEFLAQTDGGRTERLMEKSLPTCLSYSSQDGRDRERERRGGGNVEATGLKALTIKTASYCLLR